MITQSTHRLRTEEKKLYRKLFLTIASLIFSALLFLFVGLPLFARIIFGLTSLNQNKSVENKSSSAVLFPPTLDPVLEATNSAKIKISGYGDKDTTVIIMVNDVEVVKVTADKDGKFSANNITLDQGANSITAKSALKDSESSPSSPINIVYKKTPPKLDVESPSDGEKFYSENKEANISGKTDPENTISVNERFVIVDQDGNFSYKLPLSDGENKLKIIATDQAGNQTTEERKVNYTP